MWGTYLKTKIAVKGIKKQNIDKYIKELETSISFIENKIRFYIFINKDNDAINNFCKELNLLLKKYKEKLEGFYILNLFKNEIEQCKKKFMFFNKNKKILTNNSFGLGICGLELYTDIYAIRVLKEDINYTIQNNNDTIKMLDSDIFELSSIKKNSSDDVNNISFELCSKFDCYKDVLNQNVILNIIQKDIDNAVDD